MINELICKRANVFDASLRSLRRRHTSLSIGGNEHLPPVVRKLVQPPRGRSYASRRHAASHCGTHSAGTAPKFGRESPVANGILTAEGCGCGGKNAPARNTCARVVVDMLAGLCVLVFFPNNLNKCENCVLHSFIALRALADAAAVPATTFEAANGDCGSPSTARVPDGHLIGFYFIMIMSSTAHGVLFVTV